MLLRLGRRSLGCALCGCGRGLSLLRQRGLLHREGGSHGAFVTPAGKSHSVISFPSESSPHSRVEGLQSFFVFAVLGMEHRARQEHTTECCTSLDLLLGGMLIFGSTEDGTWGLCTDLYPNLSKNNLRQDLTKSKLLRLGLLLFSFLGGAGA